MHWDRAGPNGDVMHVDLVLSCGVVTRQLCQLVIKQGSSVIVIA